MDNRLRNISIVLGVCLIIIYGRSILFGDFTKNSEEVDEWLEQNDLAGYKLLFKENGITTLAGCGTPEQLDSLPELPASEERRLRRAAQMLQQRLVLRQWLVTHKLQHTYSKLLNMDVSSIEDVYWLEDSTSSQVLEPKDRSPWSKARQSLPTRKEKLETLKSELWSAVVKNSHHQDAWTWGGMLVVSVSMAGLVTLAAMTQPSLAPEAKHSLLQYVTGKYLHPASCKIEWGWSEPAAVGGTMWFKVVCVQRNGHPYPVCENDQFHVVITHGTRLIPTAIEYGSKEPNEAHKVKVTFTVRSAGLYLILVMIGGSAVCDGGARRWFCAGSLDPTRTTLARPAAATVWSAGHPKRMHIYPKDQYDNPVPLANDEEAIKSFSITITDVSNVPIPLSAYETSWTYDCVNERVSLSLSFATAGVYTATLAYRQVTIANGEVQCIVLNAADSATLQRNVSSRRHNMCYEARLIGDPGTPQKRVLCVINSKQFQVKEYLFKIIPKQIASFRVCPSTKIVVSGDSVSLEVVEGSRSVRVWSAERDLIAASFHHLLIHNSGGDDSFKSKQEFVYSSVRRALNRYPHEKMAITVFRSDILTSSYRACRHFTVADWCKNFHITFQGEQGVDWGGVRREWFTSLCGKLFSPNEGLFTSFTDSPTALVHPNHNRQPHLKLKHYEFAGKIVGKCIYESALGDSYRQLVRARLTRSFLAQIIGLPVHHKHFEQDDPELYLSKIKYVLSADLDQEDEMYFTDEEYHLNGKLKETVDLIPNGASVRVTNENKVRYLDALAQYRLATRTKAEVDAFLKGLTLLIPDNILAIFDENQLELVLCGVGEVCVRDWRAHSVWSGSGGSGGETRRWWWTAVEGLTPEERGRLLQFTTGCSQLPPGGFQDLNPRFQITASPNFGALPTAHTCFNQLCLPDYESYDHMVKALLWAINEGSEGFAMI